MLLGVIVFIAIAWLVQSLRTNPGLPDQRIVRASVGVAAFTGFTVHQFIARRLRAFVEHSPLCHEALTPAGRVIYHGFCLLLAAAFVAITAFLVHVGDLDAGAVLAVVGIGALTVGAFASALFQRLREQVAQIPLRHPRQSPLITRAEQNSFGNVFTRSWVTVARRQTGLRPGRAMLLAVAAAAGVVIAIASVVIGASNPPAERISLAVLGFAGALTLARIDDQVIRFTAFAGLAPWPSAAAFWLAPLSFLVGSTATIVLLSFAQGQSTLTSLIVIAVVVVATLFIVAVRVWQCRLMRRDVADRMLSLDAAAAMLLGLLFWPLGLAWAAWRVTRIYRQAQNATWTMP